MVKAIKLLLICLLFAIQTKAQVRLGYSESELRREFSEEPIFSGTTDAGYRYIYITGKHAIRYYYFDDKTNLTDMCCIMPITNGALNYLVEMYNKQAVIIDNYNWKSYDTGGAVTYITLREISGQMIFIFTSGRPFD